MFLYLKRQIERILQFESGFKPNYWRIKDSVSNITWRILLGKKAFAQMLFHEFDECMSNMEDSLPARLAFDELCTLYQDKEGNPTKDFFHDITQEQFNSTMNYYRALLYREKRAGVTGIGRTHIRFVANDKGDKKFIRAPFYIVPKEDVVELSSCYYKVAFLTSGWEEMKKSLNISDIDENISRLE